MSVPVKAPALESTSKVHWARVTLAGSVVPSHNKLRTTLAPDESTSLIALGGVEIRCEVPTAADKIKPWRKGLSPALICSNTCSPGIDAIAAWHRRGVKLDLEAASTTQTGAQADTAAAQQPNHAAKKDDNAVRR